MSHEVRAIAFYLPQFHPIPENDEWWGKGFTEWTNVAKAKPLFPGHYQPHLPTDLGFYDLRLPEIRASQAELAKEYGIYGFCYYHYWFNGKQILERPVEEILKSSEPDFPFCLCWANENWTRAWDGGEKEILLEQKYSFEDDKAHIEHLMPYFKDSRYITINGKPLFLIYRTELFPDIKKTTAIWQAAAKKAGLKGLFLARVEGFKSDIDPKSIDFDAAVEFAPDWRKIKGILYRNKLHRMLIDFGLLPTYYLNAVISKYDGLVSQMLAKPDPDYKLFRCVTPGFDNSARRNTNATILINNTPAKYANWLHKVIERTMNKYQGDEQIVFINAWNEWAEGNHLEPDHKNGRAFLEATCNALAEATSKDHQENIKSEKVTPTKAITLLHRFYWEIIHNKNAFLEIVKHIKFNLFK